MLSLPLIGQDVASPILTALCPSASVTDLSRIKSTAWTSPGHHKSGPHAHGAITGEHEGRGRVANCGLHICEGASRPGLLQFLLCAARRFSWFHDSFVNARMCSPGRALIRFAQRSTIQKDGSGHHTSGVWYTQPHYLSEIRTFILVTWTEMHGAERLQCPL